MFWLIAAGLVLITLYATTLAYSLRQYSRGALSERLEDSQQHWVPWLERYAGELPVLVSLLRIAANMFLLMTVLVWFFGLPAEFRPVQLLAPLLIVLGLLLVFSVAIPQAVALHAGDGFLAANLRVLYVLRILLWPVRYVHRAVEFIVRRLLGRPEATLEAETQRVEKVILAAVNEGEISGTVAEEQRDMIRSVIELNQTTVSAIMTPRTAIVALPVDASFTQITAAIREQQHSRIPMYEGTMDQIIGVLYAKDLIGVDTEQPFDVRAITRSVPYVPASKPIHAMLSEFRQSKVHIAIVLDEYGGTAGLVTIEDILEEVVGEIEDEHDEEAPSPIRRLDANTIEADGGVHVAEINSELDLEIPEDGVYETIGGFVLTRLGKVPAAGEEVQHENVTIRVVEAEPRRIVRVRLTMLPQEAAKSA